MIALLKNTTVLALLFASTVVFASTPENTSDGAQTYNQCIGCHSFSYNRTGPKHCGLFGRLAGSLQDYEYSDSMRSSGIVWNAQTLNDFLRSPFTFIPGTKMGFVGIADTKKRQDLISYMLVQQQSEQCKPQSS